MATRQFDFIVGAETSTAPSFATPSSSDDIMTKGYADANYGMLASDANQYQNGTVSASVGSNILTVSLKDAAGSNPSAGSLVRVAFRNSTAGTGTLSVVDVTSSLSMTVSSGSTLGHASAVASYIYVYLINNAGTAELAVSSKIFDEGSLVSTTAEGGAGAADSPSVMYSTSARSNVACRLIGRLLSSQTTAGTWASSMTEISNVPFSLTVGLSKFAARTTTTQSVTNNSDTELGSNWTDSADAYVFDLNSEFDASTGRFTPKREGYYHLIAGASVSSLGDANPAQIGIYKNGSSSPVFARSNTYIGATGQAQLTCSGFIYLNGTTDYVSVFFFQADSTSRNVGSSFFQGFRIA